MGKVQVLSAVGRYVMGSLTVGLEKSMDGSPLIYKSGKNIGQPRLKYVFGVAFQKTPGIHWSQEEWMKPIWLEGHKGNSNAYQMEDFSWKVIDGDSTKLNKNNTRPCDHEGYPGHWVLVFADSTPPRLFFEKNGQAFPYEGTIKPGDFIQVYFDVEYNNSAQNPGVYLNPKMVCFRAWGEEIILGTDPNSVGFGGGTLPPGASLVPQGMTGAPPPPAAVQQQAPPPPAAVQQQAPPPPAAVQPNPQFLQAPQLTAKANGSSYEDLIKAGWNDALLREHGYMI